MLHCFKLSLVVVIEESYYLTKINEFKLHETPYNKSTISTRSWMETYYHNIQCFCTTHTVVNES
jgi:hypothetical protein